MFLLSPALGAEDHPHETRAQRSLRGVETVPLSLTQLCRRRNPVAVVVLAAAIAVAVDDVDAAGGG
jgi:hypothetical protein